MMVGAHTYFFLTLKGLVNLLADAIFVGTIDFAYSLIQSDTYLYVINMHKLR